MDAVDEAANAAFFGYPGASRGQSAPRKHGGARGLDRLSFTHAVHVIKRKMPQAAVVPPERLAHWRDALLDEIAHGRCVSSRGRFNPRGIKRKTSNSNIRRRSEPLHLPHQPTPMLRI